MAYSRYYRRILTPEEKPLYDALAEGLTRMDAQIPIPFAPQLNPSRYTQAVLLDYPELFYVDFSRLSFSFSPLGSRVAAVYRAPAEQIRRQAEEIGRVADGIVYGCAGKAPVEAERVLHDGLAELCTYGTLADREDDAHSIHGAFLDRLCVCEGYAKAFKYLCDRAKLQCLVIEGEASPPNQESGPHTWNMINLDGEIYHVDVTFDRLIEKRHHSMAYFNLSDAEIGFDHTPWTSMFRPPQSPKSGAVIPTIGGTQQLIDYLRGEYARRARHSEMLLTKGFPQNAIFPMIQKKLKPTDYVWYSAIKTSYYGEGARSFSIVWK